MATARPERRALRSMNSDVELMAYGCRPFRRLDRAAAWLRGFERRFSRFEPSSELSRLNASAGARFKVSPQMLRLLLLSMHLAERSGGLFDPTVLRRLEAAGYDRTFEQVTGRVEEPPAAIRPEGVSWKDVTIDQAHRTVTLPPASGIDLGGIGKSWAVDRLSSIIGKPGMVNAGGDLFAAGRPHDADAWLVGVENPFFPERDLAVLAVRDRGVATSTTRRRQWLDGRRWSHHLIDPSSGEPSTSDAVQVAAVAESCLLADYHAKVALLMGLSGGLDYLAATGGVEGLMVGTDKVVYTTGLRSYLVSLQAEGECIGD